MAGAVDHCVGAICLHLNGRMLTPNEASPVYGSERQICDSSFTKSPCNLNKNPVSDVLPFIVSSKNFDQQKTGNAFNFLVFESSHLQDISENNKVGHFQMITDTTPIYLQNLSLIC